MNIHVTEEAARKYKNEMNIGEGQCLRFFVKLYGQNQVHPNFSLGVSRDTPRSPRVSTTVSGITFYLEEQDVWFIRDHDLSVFVLGNEIEFQLIPCIRPTR